ncbi:hypothetical protein BOQ63_006955 (plasmid) [Streptomyces viridifaciens]|uniref:hypothetical protein n=1 Tax=Kitasatospora aureofaciens TaxID=1894 RepID=UPI0011610885|nr:hypothetical protein BOQ63_006955 [Streptomyces viridifaciens]
MLKFRKVARRTVAATAAAVAFAGGTALTAGTAYASPTTYCHFRTAVNVSGVDLKPGICITSDQSASWVVMVGGSSQLPSGAHVVFAMNKVVNGQAVPQFYENGATCSGPGGCSYTPWQGGVQPGNYYNVSMSWVDGNGVWHGNVQSPTYWLS